MANRSYLYTHHPDEEPAYRDVSEWAFDLPLTHLLLVGAEPTVSASAIWQVDAKIALQGNARESRPLFLAFLDWLAPQLPAGFRAAAQEAQAFLARPDRQGGYFHLELGEIYELQGLDLAGMERETAANAARARELFAEVQRLVATEGTTLDDAAHAQLGQLRADWEQHLGLSFSDNLYYHLG